MVLLYEDGPFQSFGFIMFWNRFVCTGVILCAFWVVVRIQSRPCTILGDTYVPSRGDNDIAILLEVLQMVAEWCFLMSCENPSQKLSTFARELRLDNFPLDQFASRPTLKQIVWGIAPRKFRFESSV